MADDKLHHECATMPEKERCLACRATAPAGGVTGALNACKAACERIIDQYDGEVTAGIDWRALLSSIDRALSTHHAAPGAPQQEASGETVAAFLELARLYCSVTETLSGDVSWTFATRDIEGFAVEVINQHRSRAAATAPAGGLTDPLRDLSAGGQFDLLGEKPLTTAARAAEPESARLWNALIDLPGARRRIWNHVIDDELKAGHSSIESVLRAASPTPPVGTSKEGGR